MCLLNALYTMTGTIKQLITLKDGIDGHPCSESFLNINYEKMLCVDHKSQGEGQLNGSFPNYNSWEWKGKVSECMGSRAGASSQIHCVFFVVGGSRLLMPSYIRVLHPCTLALGKALILVQMISLSVTEITLDDSLMLSIASLSTFYAPFLTPLHHLMLQIMCWLAHLLFRASSVAFKILFLMFLNVPHNFSKQILQVNTLKMKAYKWEFSTSRALKMVFTHTVTAYLAALAFGAPIFSMITETLVFSALLGVLSSLPCLWFCGTKHLHLIDLYVTAKNNKNERMAEFVTVMTIFGAWIGSIVIPLDWERWWQEWPISNCISLCFFSTIGWVCCFTVFKWCPQWLPFQQTEKD